MSKLGVSDNDGIMSDMVSQRITVRVPATLGTRLRHSSRLNGRTPSDLVRVALENYLGEKNSGDSAHELAEAAGFDRLRTPCPERSEHELAAF